MVCDRFSLADQCPHGPAVGCTFQALFAASLLLRCARATRVGTRAGTRVVCLRLLALRSCYVRRSFAILHGLLACRIGMDTPVREPSLAHRSRGHQCVFTAH